MTEYRDLSVTTDHMTEYRDLSVITDHTKEYGDLAVPLTATLEPGCKARRTLRLLGLLSFHPSAHHLFSLSQKAVLVSISGLTSYEIPTEHCGYLGEGVPNEYRGSRWLLLLPAELHHSSPMFGVPIGSNQVRSIGSVH
jgi:hypothetical protein